MPKKCGCNTTLHRVGPLSTAAALLGSLLTSNAFAQSTATAAPLTLPSTTDNLLSVLPGVLIAGIVLVFAIRERARARRLQQALDEAHLASQSMTLQSSRFRAAAEHGLVGLWQLDSAGRTLYANPVMCQLLGVDRFTELKHIRDERLLEPLSDNSVAVRQDNDGGDLSYSAVIRALSDGTQHSVLVFETRIVSRLGDSTTVLRTVIDPTMLPCNLLDKRGNQLTVAAA